MDLTPFSGINPCGHAGLEVTSMALLLGERCPDMEIVGKSLFTHLVSGLSATA
jgi:lipoyl(octanoyl) transferase